MESDPTTQRLPVRNQMQWTANSKKYLLNCGQRYLVKNLLDTRIQQWSGEIQQLLKAVCSPDEVTEASNLGHTFREGQDPTLYSLLVDASVMMPNKRRDTLYEQSGKGSGDWVTGDRPMLIPKSQYLIELWSPKETFTWFQANFPKELVENEDIRDIFCACSGTNLLHLDTIESDLADCDDIPEEIHVGGAKMKTMDWMTKMLARVRSIASQQPRLLAMRALA